MKSGFVWTSTLRDHLDSNFDIPISEDYLQVVEICTQEISQ